MLQNNSGRWSPAYMSKVPRAYVETVETVETTKVNGLDDCLWPKFLTRFTKSTKSMIRSLWICCFVFSWVIILCANPVLSGANPLYAALCSFQLSLIIIIWLSLIALPLHTYPAGACSYMHVHVQGYIESLGTYDYRVITLLNLILLLLEAVFLEEVGLRAAQLFQQPNN